MEEQIVTAIIQLRSGEEVKVQGKLTVEKGMIRYGDTIIKMDPKAVKKEYYVKGVVQSLDRSVIKMETEK